MDLSNRLTEDVNPKSVHVSFINGGKVTIDVKVFLIYEKMASVDLLNGLYT